ncbi:MAG: VanW family protein [Polyangiaceae bacterium]
MPFSLPPSRLASVGKWMAAWLGVSTAVSAGGLVAAIPWTRSACLWGEGACAGLRIGGENVDHRDLASALDARAQAIAAQPIDVTLAGVAGFRKSLTLGELGVSIDAARTIALAKSVGHRGSLADRFDEVSRAAEGAIDVPLVFSVNDETLRQTLDAIKDATDEKPVPARIDLAKGDVVPHVSGRFLDVAGAVDRVRDAAESGAREVVLERFSVDPRVSSEFLRHVDSKKQLARFQTHFSRHGDQATRAQNIDTASARLDGTVLLPHELFSFNAAVGPRTVENGFSRGWEIFKGEMVEGIGGGTCQVASTFHAAAFLAGLDILERLPHSRPSAYITMGLDATVVYPMVDLKIRNPYDFPVVVHSHVEGNTVFFELLGKDRPARVLFKREIVATRPYPRKVEEKKGMPRDRVVRKQHGIPGYKIKRTRMIAFGDGTPSRKEENVDVYWPTFELYLVAPGVDPEPLLPPPSEGQEDPGGSSWAAPPDEEPPPADAVEPVAAAIPGATTVPGATTMPGAVMPGATMTGATMSASTNGVNVPAASLEGASARPKIQEAPGIHPPRADQLRAPMKVVIGAGVR